MEKNCEISLAQLIGSHLKCNTDLVAPGCIPVIHHKIAVPVFFSQASGDFQTKLVQHSNRQWIIQQAVPSALLEHLGNCHFIEGNYHHNQPSPITTMNYCYMQTVPQKPPPIPPLFYFLFFITRAAAAGSTHR